MPNARFAPKLRTLVGDSQAQGLKSGQGVLSTDTASPCRFGRLEEWEHAMCRGRLKQRNFEIEQAYADGMTRFQSGTRQPHSMTLREVQCNGHSPFHFGEVVAAFDEASADGELKDHPTVVSDQ